MPAKAFPNGEIRRISKGEVEHGEERGTISRPHGYAVPKGPTTDHALLLETNTITCFSILQSAFISLRTTTVYLPR